MSFGRKTYDGIILGRRSGFTERRDPLSDKDKVGFNAFSGPPKRNFGPIEDLPEEDNDKDRYLITYADLITLLLGLFIILYAISNIDLNKYQKLMTSINSTFGGSNTKIKVIEVKELKKTDLKSGIEDLINNYGYKDYLKVEENQRGVTIHILEDILFPSGTADLKESSVNVLSRIAGILKMLPNDIRIEGHSDNIPINNSIYPSNWHLSVSRALNTAYHLINVEKLPADKISIVGYSEYKPIASNDSFEGRRQNRRVDIIIIKK